MNLNYIDLAKKLVASKNWKWLPGMVAINDNGSWLRLEEKRKRLFGDWKKAYPKLDDQATSLLLRSIVQDLYPEKPLGLYTTEMLTTSNEVKRNYVVNYYSSEDDWKQSQGDSELEALINLILKDSFKEDASVKKTVKYKYSRSSFEKNIDNNLYMLSSLLDEFTSSIKVLQCKLLSIKHGLQQDDVERKVIYDNILDSLDCIVECKKSIEIIDKNVTGISNDLFKISSKILEK